jgi:hypothetical protein
LMHSDISMRTGTGFHRALRARAWMRSSRPEPVTTPTPQR